MYLIAVLLVAIVATVVAFIQSLVLFAFGLKEMATLSSPFSFVGIFLLEVVLIWAAYFGATPSGRVNPTYASESLISGADLVAMNGTRHRGHVEKFEPDPRQSALVKTEPPRNFVRNVQFPALDIGPAVVDSHDLAPMIPRVHDAHY